MGRVARQQQKLAALEADFRSALARQLKAAVDNKDSRLFLSDRHNPWPELTPWTDSQTNELLHLADTILALNKELDKSISGCLAERFLRYCEVFNDTTNPQRLGVQKHAARLLTEIESDDSA